MDFTAAPPGSRVRRGGRTVRSSTVPPTRNFATVHRPRRRAPCRAAVWSAPSFACARDATSASPIAATPRARAAPGVLIAGRRRSASATTRPYRPAAPAARGPAPAARGRRAGRNDDATPPCGIRRAGHTFRPCPGGGGNPLRCHSRSPDRATAAPICARSTPARSGRHRRVPSPRTPPQPASCSCSSRRTSRRRSRTRSPAPIASNVSADRRSRCSAPAPRSIASTTGARSSRSSRRSPPIRASCWCSATSSTSAKAQASAGSDAIRAAQYGLDKIGAPRAHELSTGRGVKIAVIDTGIDADHPDLKGAIVETFDAIGQ